MSEKAYRYEDLLESSGYDEDTHTFYSDVKVRLSTYTITKRTPCGFWIHCPYEYPRYKRFVLEAAKKKYACLTKDEALTSFIRRKERQVDILESRLETAKNALRQAEGISKVLVDSQGDTG